MIEVKICGITTVKDALVAAESGADALGFIFYSGSPRHVTPERAAAIVRHLPREIARVGVFVNHNIDEVRNIVLHCGLDLIQLHGGESSEYCRHFPSSTVIKVFSPRREEDLTGMEHYHLQAVLVDTYDPERYGGVGRISDWNLARKVGEKYPLILSGGLHRENIQDAIVAVSPRAVDINSGVEVSPGEKDPEKVREIIDIVKHGNPITNGTRTNIFDTPRRAGNATAESPTYVRSPPRITEHTCNTMKTFNGHSQKR